MGYLKKKRDRRNYELSHPRPCKSDFYVNYDPVIAELNRKAFEEEFTRLPLHMWDR